MPASKPCSGRPRLQGELNQQIERLDRSAASLASRRQDVQRELDAAAHTEASLGQSVLANEKRSTDLAAEIAQIGQLVAELTAHVEKYRGLREEIEQELHDLELRFGEVRVRVETLVQRTLEELALDLPARYTELSAEKPYEPAEMDWDAVAAEIKELRDKIHRLGNVNVEAIGEQDELDQRFGFLTAQVTRPHHRQVAARAVDPPDQHRKQRPIRADLQCRPRALPGNVPQALRRRQGRHLSGDRARSAAQHAAPIGPDGEPMPLAKIKVDVLDAGIEIIARPPGKQPVSISQLSGGEKTMTCVALLMSIFKSKPSPFCILDEVDAALDEANNQRFNMIVQEFLDQSQFIVITHSKRTMQIAEVLYGVTMQEQGVSKRVAVKFDQVDSQGRISEQAAA